MEDEIWKVYKITTNRRYGKRVYEVSNMGRLKLNGELYEPNTNEKGYFLFPAKKPKFLHQAVAELFVPNPDNKPEVDHINAIRDDNRSCNLRYVTHKENCNNPLSIKNYSNSLKGNTYTRGKHWKWKSKPTEEVKQMISDRFKGKHLKLENGKRVWY